MDTPADPSRRTRRKTIVLSLLALFLLPIAARAAIFAYEGGPTSWRNADWSSTGSLPDPGADSQARVLIMSGRTGGWKGVFSVHSWVVLKPENARSWRRYDVVGWGNPVRLNGWAPDGLWFGNKPQVVLDLQGAAATNAIPKIEAAIKSYNYANAGDYRIWPGPNSNTFVAHLAREIPEMRLTLPVIAIGKDYLPLGQFVAPAPSGTGYQLSVGGLFGLTLARDEGVEINLLGLAAGIDLRHPALKLPGVGRVPG